MKLKASWAGSFSVEVQYKWTSFVLRENLCDSVCVCYERFKEQRPLMISSSTFWYSARNFSFGSEESLLGLIFVGSDISTVTTTTFWKEEKRKISNKSPKEQYKAVVMNEWQDVFELTKKRSREKSISIECIIQNSKNQRLGEFCRSI